MLYGDLTTQTVKAMLDSGTPPTEVLQITARRACIDPAAYRLSLARGADVNARNHIGYTPLIEVAQFKDGAKALMALLDAGADVDAVNDEGETALMQAAHWFGGVESAKVLVKAGANKTIKDKRGRTAADHARAFGGTAKTFEEREEERRQLASLVECV